MRRALALRCALALCACGGGPQPMAPAELAAARAAALPGAERRCATYGFSETTAPPRSFGVENAMNERLEQEFGWRRMRRSGLDIWGSERMVAIARCACARVLPASGGMPACIQAETELVIRENALRSRQLAAQEAAAAAAWRAANRTIICNRFGNTLICD